MADSEAPSLAPLPSRAFDEFYATEYPAVVRVVASTTRRWAVAEEIAQEAMWEASRRWESVQLLDRPDFWVRRVAVRRAISWRRRVVAEATALGRATAVAASVPEDRVPDPALWRAIQALPRRQAVAVVLWGMEQRTAEEIGEVLGCSAETARTHVRRARARLKEAL